MNDNTRVAEANTDFGLRLFARLAAEAGDANVVMSPLSLSIVLAMLYNGAETTTRNAMADALGWTDVDLAQVNAAGEDILRAYRGYAPGVRLDLANAIWLNGETLAPDYTQRIRHAYGAEAMQGVDVDAINAWIAAATEGKIVNLLTPNDLNMARLVLANALYFKGTWTTAFDPAWTEPGEFRLLDGRARPMPMMSQQTDYPYFENGLCQAVYLPYGDRHVGMFVLLPRPHVTLDALTQALSRQTPQEWAAAMAWRKVALRLPRFTVNCKAQLQAALAELGLAEMFSRAADFSGMAQRGLFVSRVIHGAVMDVNEAGTEAAASTVAVMVRGMPEPVTEMVVDRPFLCFIADDTVGVPVIAARITDPQPLPDPELE